ncbi:MAG TPA: hydroxymethylpyrimidine/phosphomethylpyrimidine kinase, partial [Polyangiaceae bacterium]
MAKTLSASLPCALTISGLDPGGGAGLAADLRAFSRAGAFGCAVASALTVQSTAGLRGVRPVGPALVMAQAREVLAHQDVRAIKTGALATSQNVRKVAELLAIHRDVPCVVDPVMIPTRGPGRLLQPSATAAMKKHLVPRATLITANAPEAEALTSLRVLDIASATAAAKKLVDMGAVAALVKGGHFNALAKEATDVLVIGKKVIVLSAPRLKLAPLHGGGCTLASLVAGRLAANSKKAAMAERLEEAVTWARKTHHK